MGLYSYDNLSKSTKKTLKTQKIKWLRQTAGFKWKISGLFLSKKGIDLFVLKKKWQGKSDKKILIV